MRLYQIARNTFIKKETLCARQHVDNICMFFSTMCSKLVLSSHIDFNFENTVLCTQVGEKISGRNKTRTFRQFFHFHFVYLILLFFPCNHIFSLCAHINLIFINKIKFSYILSLFIFIIICVNVKLKDLSWRRIYTLKVSRVAISQEKWKFLFWKTRLVFPIYIQYIPTCENVLVIFYFLCVFCIVIFILRSWI